MRNKKKILLLFFLVILVISVLSYFWIESAPSIRFVTLAKAEDARAFKEHGNREHIIVITRKADWPEDYEQVYIESTKVQEFWDSWEWKIPMDRFLIQED